MKMNKKISALLSCILACSSINPASAARISDYENSEYDDDDQIDENESQENENNAPWLKPLLYMLGAFGTAYAGYKGVQIGRSYHARNMINGKAWDWTLFDSDKKTLFLVLNSIKELDVSSVKGKLDRLLTLNQNWNEDECRLMFNLNKLFTLEIDILKTAENWNSVSSDFKHICWLLDNDALQPFNNVTLQQLREQSEKAVKFMNNVLDKKVSLSLNEELVRKPLERSRLIVNFIDKIGPETLEEVYLNSKKVQLSDDPVNGHRKNKIEWYDQVGTPTPRKKLEFSRLGNEILV